MNLFEEVLEAKQEFLQDEWDKLLVDLWKNNPNAVMMFEVSAFMHKHHLSTKEFFSLKRTPRYAYQQRVRITRYIAAYLPFLNTHLWNGNKTTEELLKICSKLTLMWNPADRDKIVSEAQDKNKIKRKYKQSVVEQKAYDDFKEKYNRSNWGAAKK